MKLVYCMAGVRTGVHVFAICVKTGIIFKMRSMSFFHVSVPNIYGTSSSTYLIIFLKVMSKVLYFNITQKFTNLWFCEALSASGSLFLTEASYTLILRHIKSFFLVLLDAFSSRFFEQQTFSFSIHFSLLHISVSCFQAFSKLPLRSPLRHI